MTKHVRIAIASLGAALVTVSSAAAITGGAVDGDAHPYAGALVVNGSVACSGVLIAPTVFATAGHCGADGARVSVSLDTRLDAGWSLLGGTLEVDPTRGADLAVVVLDAPAGVQPAVLPSEGLVASLAKGSPVTSVGYGYSSRAADGSFVYDGLRRNATSSVAGVSKSLLKLSTRVGGPCMGDSGGPQLSGDTVLSVTSGGSKDCTGKAEGYRLDTVSARAFLSGFVVLP